MNDYGPPQGRKRSGDFGRGGGGAFADDGGFRKRQRFDDDSGAGGGAGRNATLRVLIRNTDAGGIIGKGGENIKRLRKQYDCQVVLPDSAGAPERVMTIMGILPNCVGVLGDVLNGIAEDPRSTHSKDPNRREVQILIPQPFMGTIIGTQGSKIKELRTRTSANIKIFTDPMPGSNERSIQLIGSIQQITECAEHFLEDIGKKEPREPIYLYEPGQHNDGPPPPGPPPMDMRFPPRGRGGTGGGGGFRGRGGGGRGGAMGGDGGGSWRNSGGRGGGNNRGRGGRGGGRFNGSNSGDGFQFGSQSSGSTFNQGGGGGGGGGGRGSNVGYGGGAAPNVGYTGNQSSGGNAPPSGSSHTSSSNVSYPQQGAAPSQGSTYPPPLVPPSGGAAPANQSQQVTIPAEFADAILGVNGGNLHQIKNQSSCDIVLEPPKPGTNQRIITISGTPSGIQFAQQLMQNSVRQQHPHV